MILLLYCFYNNYHYVKCRFKYIQIKIISFYFFNTVGLFLWIIHENIIIMKFLSNS